MNLSIDSALNQSQLVEEAWSESAAQDAIDVNPVISALQAGDAIFDGLDAQQKAQSMAKYASISVALAKGAQTLVNQFASFDSNIGTNKEEALRASKYLDLGQKVLETLGAAASCKSFLTNLKDTDSGNCIKAISGVVDTAEAAYGDGVFKANKNIDNAKIKATLKVVADQISTASATLEFIDTIPNGGAKLQRATFGLAGAFLKTVRDAATLGYASNGAEPPKTGATALLLGIIDNAAAPILAVGKNCVGVKDSPDDLAQYWKCISSQAQETGKVAVKLAFASVGAVEAVRKVGAMNESIVAKEVIYQILTTGAGNEGELYRKYKVSYSNDSSWQWVSPINSLIRKIGASKPRAIASKF